MSGWSEVSLGVIAVATLAIAVVQVALIVAAIGLARRVGRLADQVEHELKPLLTSVNEIGREASRAVALAAVQVERADRLFADMATKVERSLDAVQSGLIQPLVEGRALLVGIRAVIDVFRRARNRSRGRRSEEEDALFI